MNNFVNELEFDFKNITNISFHGKIVKLSFSCNFSKRLFLSKIVKSKKSVHSKSFSHSSLPSKERRYGNILYHAIKSNYVNNYKCVLNTRCNKFELRHIVNNKPDWNSEPLVITDDKLNEWTSSFHKFHNITDRNVSNTVSSNTSQPSN